MPLYTMIMEARSARTLFPSRAAPAWLRLRRFIAGGEKRTGGAGEAPFSARPETLPAKVNGGFAGVGRRNGGW